MVLAGHFERGGDGARAASYYLRAAKQAFHVLDLRATVAHADLGLACEPPPELRIALLGMRCDASCQGLHLLGATLPDAEELLRAAAPGAIPWAQAVQAYHMGLLLAGRIGDLSASLARLQVVDPHPEALGRMSLVLLNGIFTLDNIGQVLEGTALEERFLEIIRSRGEHEPLARFWWNITVGMRGSYAHDDPWSALQHSDAIQPIFDATGDELIFLNMQVFRGLNLWYLGAGAAAERLLEGIPAADETLGPVSSLRRLILSWLRADRGAFDEARALAAELAHHGRARHVPLEEARGRWVLAEVLRRAGDLDAADREVQIALDMAAPLERPGVLGTLAMLRLAQGRAADALAAAEEASAGCAAMRGCGMFRGAFVRLAHAEARHGTGARDSARQAIAEARSRLLAIADRIGDAGHRKRFLEEVPENARTPALAREWLVEPAPSAW
jgi:hypothetical protein